MAQQPPPPIGWNLEQPINSSSDSSNTKKKRLSSSSSSSSSSNSSDEQSSKTRNEQRRKERAEKKKIRKEKKLLKKLDKAEHKKVKKEEKEARKKHKKDHKRKKDDSGDDCGVPIALMSSNCMVPETKEQYEARQSRIQRVVDPVTGRTRIIKGDGEVLEEIVSRNRHIDINKKATKADGNFFEAEAYCGVMNK